MNITEKMAYVKGLFDGLDIDTTTKEGKLLSAIMDLLNDMAIEVADLNDECAALNDVIDELDDDLAAIEEEFYDEYDDDDFTEAVCPSCGESIYLDGEAIEEGSFVCPSCGEEVEIEIECECGEDCCGK